MTTNLLTIHGPVTGFIETEYEDIPFTIEPGTYPVREMNHMDWNGFTWGLLGLEVEDPETGRCGLIYVDCETLGFVACQTNHRALHERTCPDCGGKGFLDADDLTRIDAEAVREARLEDHQGAD